MKRQNRDCQPGAPSNNVRWFTCAIKEKDTTGDNFDKYYSLNSKCYGKIKQPSSEFLSWFIGFSEGDGSFVKSKRGDLFFVVVQQTKDKQVLDFIQQELNMVLNINVQKSRGRALNRLYRFSLTKDIYQNIEPSVKTKEITLNDTWLIGFVDAEGCFHTGFSLNNNKYHLLFDLAQKGANNKEIVLDKFVELFKVGAVYKHYHDNNWNYRVNDPVQKAKLISLSKTVNDISYH
ncbi:putative intron-encoded endonuclease aI5 [Erysiphe neolycopersici]|uniref:Putative intron-encoded endonuclease aI5 n=1 Tax=Erysiphe neolycopersici TaxID=212602 RepID=A0A420I7W4_9PEZI|nr:putative intron-encoded endonuclease aI5 [Erysiphe neolycopersici]